uniref:Uncharacterized protein n=1 Tax=Timema cristinae TaxID=61476 RepID=A0A7R9DAG3_TIMCR|nr:unnamed protein product [Timema cristinae]
MGGLIMVVVVPGSSGERRNLAQSWQLFACGSCSRMFVCVRCSAKLVVLGSCGSASPQSALWPLSSLSCVCARFMWFCFTSVGTVATLIIIVCLCQVHVVLLHLSRHCGHSHHYRVFVPGSCGSASPQSALWPLSSLSCVCARFMWFCFTSVGTVATLIIIVSLWEKFQTNPTITGLDTDFHNWEVPFPAVFLCLQEPSNYTLVEKFVDTQWPAQENDTRQQYIDLVIRLANMSYLNLEEFSKMVDLPGIPQDPLQLNTIQDKSTIKHVIVQTNDLTCIVGSTDKIQVSDVRFHRRLFEVDYLHCFCLRVTYIHEECVYKIVVISGDVCRTTILSLDGDVDEVPHLTMTHPAKFQIVDPFESGIWIFVDDDHTVTAHVSQRDFMIIQTNLLSRLRVAEKFVLTDLKVPNS